MSEPSANEMNVNEAGNPQQDVDQAIRAPGAQLRALREERGWTVEQVASQLNLAPRQVQAIESDDYAALPGMAVTRGFMRAYAKLLKVDATPLLATMAGNTAMNEPAASRRPLSAPFSETRLPTLSDRQGLPVRKIGILAIVIAIAAGVWALQQSGKLQAFSGWSMSNADKALGTDAPDSSIETQQAGTKPETALPEMATDSAGQQASAPEMPAPTGAVVAPTAPALSTPAIPAPSVPTASGEAPAASKDALVLHMREDSWVEIKRANNSVMVSRLLKAGSTEAFEIAGPVSVVIGNAAAVDATLRGSPLDIKGGAGGNVARLTVK